MAVQACERCGRKAETQTVRTKDNNQRVQLCAECIKIVIRPNTAWEVKK